MTLKRVNHFATKEPARLKRELSQLEDNINAEFILARKELAPQARVASFMARPSLGIVAAQPDQQLSVDTRRANAALVFPPPAPSNFGRKFVLIKRTPGNSIVTSCEDSTVPCNGGAFPAFTAVGVYTFWCDASGYYAT